MTICLDGFVLVYFIILHTINGYQIKQDFARIILFQWSSLEQIDKRVRVKFYVIILIFGDKFPSLLWVSFQFSLHLPRQSRKYFGFLNMLFSLLLMGLRKPASGCGFSRCVIGPLVARCCFLLFCRIVVSDTFLISNHNVIIATFCFFLLSKSFKSYFRERFCKI